MFFWYSDHLAVFEALISWACFGKLDYKYKHERNYIFHNFFQDYKKISNFSYKWFCQFSCLNMTEQDQIALIDSW